MNAIDARHMEAAVAAALESVLPGARRRESSSPAGDSVLRRFGVALELDADGSRWLLRLAADAGSCAYFLARMLGRSATPAEVEDMSTEALAELCNLLGGHVAGILGGEGVDLTLGIPQVADDGGIDGWRLWELEGHPLALQCVKQESTA